MTVKHTKQQNTMGKRILVTGTSVREELLNPLREAGYVVDNPQHLLSEDELGAALAGASGYLLGGDEFASRAALSKAKDLKVIAFLGMGYESFIDAPAAADLGILITNTPGTLSNSVAEFSIGHLLNATRRIGFYSSLFEKGKTGTEEKQHDVASLHVGVVGLGGIGTRIAEILRRGFGSRVSYFSRTRKPDLEKLLDISFVELPSLVSQVDVLILMASGGADSKGLLSSEVLNGSRNGLILINTARPELITPSALHAGLLSGKIAYAGFDGFYDDTEELTATLKEFIPEKLTVTGHIASLTHEARDGMARLATRSIVNILSTGKDDHIVSRATVK